ncbi:unnamed protein product [Arctogadus glacialis]
MMSDGRDEIINGLFPLPFLPVPTAPHAELVFHVWSLHATRVGLEAAGTKSSEVLVADRRPLNPRSEASLHRRTGGGLMKEADPTDPPHLGDLMTRNLPRCETLHQNDPVSPGQCVPDPLILRLRDTLEEEDTSTHRVQRFTSGTDRLGRWAETTVMS